MILSDLGVTLRQNRLAEALLGDHSVFTGLLAQRRLPLVHRTGAPLPLPGGGP